MKNQIQSYFKDHPLSEEIFSDMTVTPIKTLGASANSGHKRAVREMAYSEKHKVLISCGFDFDVFIWNPYM